MTKKQDKIAKRMGLALNITKLNDPERYSKICIMQCMIYNVSCCCRTCSLMFPWHDYGRCAKPFFDKMWLR